MLGLKCLLGELVVTFLLLNEPSVGQLDSWSESPGGECSAAGVRGLLRVLALLPPRRDVFCNIFIGYVLRWAF